MRLSKLFVPVLVIQLAACGGSGTPKPPTPPTPTPPPSRPSLLLKRSGTNFLDADGKVFKIRLDARCCSTDAGEPDPNWSIGSKAAIDDARAKGANVVTMRVGPFRIGADWTWGHEVGGPYQEVGGSGASALVAPVNSFRRFPWRQKQSELPVRSEGLPTLLAPQLIQGLATRADLTQWNPRYFAYVNSMIDYAGSLGLRVELDVDDGWGIKHCKRRDIGDYHPWQKENNLQNQDACSLAGTVEVNSADSRTAIYEAWIRKQVSEFGHHTGLLWLIGNENNLIPGFVPAWEFSHAAIIIDEETRRGFPHHPIGTQTENPGIIADPRIDFSEWHTGGTAIDLSQCQGKPCGVNEYNPDPPLTPGVVQNSFCTAEANGTWFGLWRHSQSRAAWDESWRLIEEGCGTPPPGCRHPNFEDVPPDYIWTTISKPAQHLEQMALAIEAVKTANPAWWSGDCLVGLPPEDTPEHAAERWARFETVIDQISGHMRNSSGVCAWAHRRVEIHSHRSDLHWAQLHPLHTGSGCLRPLPNSYINTWVEPGTSSPPMEACNLTNSQISEWRWTVKKEGGQLLDLTVHVCGPEARAELKQCGTSCCPLGDIEGNGACRQKLLGNPVLEMEVPGSARLVPQGNEPHFTVKVAEGAGFLKARGTKGPNAFRKWPVAATVPACQADVLDICPSEPVF